LFKCLRYYGAGIPLSSLNISVHVRTVYTKYSKLFDSKVYDNSGRWKHIPWNFLCLQ